MFMKKSALIALACMAGVSAFAQGHASFRNKPDDFYRYPQPDPYERRVFGPDGVGLIGTNWLAALYFGSAANQAADSLVQIAGPPSRFVGTNVGSPSHFYGYWIGSTKALPDRKSVV